jgi:hypothetical protein
MEWIKLAQGRVLMWAHSYIIMEPWVTLDARKSAEYLFHKKETAALFTSNQRVSP